MAANATPSQSDPIHRGAFIARRLSCLAISAPPDGVPPLPANPNGKSNRQIVADHTEQAGSPCRNCHSTIINPFGFAFEGYDATGAHRTDDNGQPINSATTVSLDGQTIAVANGVELAEALSKSEAIHKCYLRGWVEFASGRSHHRADDPWIERLARTSLSDSKSIKDLVVELVQSPAFRSRNLEELP